MKGIINTEVNERQRPNVNSRILQFYAVGDTINIVESVLGDPFDGEDIWYKLTNDAFVWSGAVDLQVDSSGLSEEDRNQWLISYRKVRDDGRPDMFANTPADHLYFSPLKLPTDSSSVRLNDLVPNLFVNGIMNAVRNLANQRDHVFIYIHGFQLLSSLKLDLLESFVNNYMTHPGNKIAKVLFMSWPAQGGPARKTVDDRSIRAGQAFTEKGLWETFTLLSQALAAEGKFLNLVVHSFGHQLLNGMLNPASGAESNLPGQIFENIFLMAPDVSHVTIKHGGEDLRNYFSDEGAEKFHYEYSRLKNIGKKVYIFHDKYDYLLYSSTKKFVGRNLKPDMLPIDRFNLTKDYRNLGNYGSRQTAFSELEPGFNFVSLEDLIANNEPIVTNDFSFRPIRKEPGRLVDKVWTDADYDGINAGRIILNMKRFPEHHRYLFTCKPVVDEVLKLL